jgi:hypothetical protein
VVKGERGGEERGRGGGRERVEAGHSTRCDYISFLCSGPHNNTTLLFVMIENTPVDKSYLSTGASTGPKP